MSLAAVTMASAAWCPSAVAGATSRRPVVLMGDAVGGARFGTAQGKALTSWR